MRAHAGSLTSANVRVDAVISRLRMPAESLAAVQLGDLIDIEPEVPGGLILQLSINGTTVAWASVREADGQLVGTIIDRNANPKLQRVDQWKLRKPPRPKG